MMNQDNPKQLLEEAIRLRNNSDFASCLEKLHLGLMNFPKVRDSSGHEVFAKEIVRTLLMEKKYALAFEMTARLKLDLTQHGILFARAFERDGNVEAARAWWTRVWETHPRHPECIKFFRANPPFPPALENFDPRNLPFGAWRKLWREMKPANGATGAPYMKSRYGPLLYVDSGDWTNWACLTGFYGNELRNIILRMPKDGTFLDIGANVGIFSLVASAHLSAGNVYSFEPNPQVYLNLLRNLELNRARNSVPFNFGIDLQTKTVRFAVRNGHSGGGRIVPDGEGEMSVLLLSGGEAMNAIGLQADRFCVCKIDTEGAELNTLLALEAAGVMDRIDQFYVEINDGHLRSLGATADDVYEVMDRNGFHARTNRRGNPHYDEIFEAAPELRKRS